MTQGAYARAPERQVHTIPLLIDLDENIGERMDLVTDDKAMTAELIKRAARFEQSVQTAPSILDRQFQ